MPETKKTFTFEFESESEEHSADWFAELFHSVCEDAKQYGIASVYGMEERDLLGDSDVFYCGYRGSLTLASGLAARMNMRFKEWMGN